MEMHSIIMEAWSRYEQMHGVTLYAPDGTSKNPACSDAHREAATKFAYEEIDRLERQQKQEERDAVLATVLVLTPDERARAADEASRPTMTCEWVRGDSADDAKLAHVLRIAARASALKERDDDEDDATYAMYNNCHGGFGLGKEFMAALAARTGIPVRFWNESIEELDVRTHPAAVNQLREWGTRASSDAGSRVCLVRIAPAAAAAHCKMREYDGCEVIYYSSTKAICEAARAAARATREGGLAARGELGAALAALGALGAAIAAADAVQVKHVDVAEPRVRVKTGGVTRWLPRVPLDLGGARAPISDASVGAAGAAGTAPALPTSEAPEDAGDGGWVQVKRRDRRARTSTRQKH